MWRADLVPTRQLRAPIGSYHHYHITLLKEGRLASQTRPVWTISIVPARDSFGSEFFLVVPLDALLKVVSMVKFGLDVGYFDRFPEFLIRDEC